MLKNQEKTSKISKYLEKTVKNFEKQEKNRQRYRKTAKMSKNWGITVKNIEKQHKR